MPAAPGRAPIGVPFAAAFDRWVGDAAGRLDAAAGVRPWRRALTGAALEELQIRLRAELARVTAPLLLAEFRDRPGRRPYRPGASDAYGRFESDLAGGLLEALVASDPCRPCAVDDVITSWRRDARRLVEALDEDSSMLRRRFGFNGAATSARQRDATCVRIQDANNIELAFKNRSVALEVAWAELVGWFNALGPSRDLRAPAAVDCGRHGWVEYLEHAPSADTGSERHDYLHRCGQTLAIVHALGGGDLHDANLLAHGEHAVVVDPTKLLRPAWTPTVGPPSVESTQLLPSPGHVARCGLVNELHVERHHRWANVGTDAVRQRRVRSWLARPEAAAAGHLAEHQDAIVRGVSAGFSEAYRLIETNPVPLEIFERCRVRVLLRSTVDYDTVIEQCLEPGGLAQPRRRSVVEGLLSQAPRQLVGRRQVAAGIRDLERRDLDALRAPRFWCRTDGTSIIHHNGELPGAFAMSPLERARRNQARLGADHHRAQLAVIRASVASSMAPQTGASYAFQRIDLGEVVV